SAVTALPDAATVGPGIDRVVVRRIYCQGVDIWVCRAEGDRNPIGSSCDALEDAPSVSPRVEGAGTHRVNRQREDKKVCQAAVDIAPVPSSVGAFVNAEAVSRPIERGRSGRVDHQRRDGDTYRKTVVGGAPASRPVGALEHTALSCCIECARSRWIHREGG